MNIEQTFEALDRAIRIATAYSSMLETGSSIEQRAQARDDKKALQSLRDSLPQLIAENEVLRALVLDLGAYVELVPDDRCNADWIDRSALLTRVEAARSQS